MSDTIEMTTDDQTGTALAVIRTALPTILSADQNDILGKLADKVKAHKPDISTAKGRDAIRSLAAEIASSKVTLVKLGKSLTEDWRTKTKAVNAECNVIEERMDALKEQVRRPLTDFENAEKARVAGHEAALLEIERWAVFPGEWTAEQIADHYAACVAHPYQERDWQEFAQRAQDFIHGSINALDRLYASKVKEETEAAELARLRAEQAERDHLAAIEAQRQREEQIAREAAEAARLAAEAKAAREAEAAAEALAEVQRKADHDTEVASRVAERAEATRVEAHQAALDAMRKLAAPLAHPDPAVVIDAKLAQLDDVYARGWEEFKPQADVAYIEHTAMLQDARVESVRLAEEAERRRRAAEEMAEAKRHAAAVEAERARVAEAQRVTDAAAAKRAENVAHRRGINQAVVKALAAAGLSEEDAVAVVTVVAKGLVPHMTIGY